MTSWAVALRDFEHCLDRIEAGLADGDATGLDAYRPPNGLSELPAEHREWAQRLAERNDAIVLQAERLLADNPPPPVSAAKSMSMSMGSSAPTRTARFEFLA